MTRKRSLYSARRVLSCGLQDHVEFRQYNALRMVNAERNIREFGHFDVIYTIGLLDYLTDDVLVRLIKSLYDTLHPGGVFIAVFKDCDRYDTIDYHWLVDWSGFLQRTRHDSWHLIETAGIPQDAVTIQRSQDDVMIFYRILRRATVAHGAPCKARTIGETRKPSRLRTVPPNARNARHPANGGGASASVSA